MRCSRSTWILAPAFVVACAGNPDKHTLAELRNVPADTQDVQVEDGLETAMQSYRRFLEETPQTSMTAEAMRRLADLKIEKEFGILGDGALVELAAPEKGELPDSRKALQARRAAANSAQPKPESEVDLERRA